MKGGGLAGGKQKESILGESWRGGVAIPGELENAGNVFDHDSLCSMGLTLIHSRACTYQSQCIKKAGLT